MGWEFCEAWQSKEDIARELVQSFTSGGSKVLAQGFTRESGDTCLWLALDVPPRAARVPPEGYRLIVLALIRKDGRSYGYKEMSEDMAPFFYGVPAHVWAEVKDHAAPCASAAEWRAKVKPTVNA